MAGLLRVQEKRHQCEHRPRFFFGKHAFPRKQHALHAQRFQFALHPRAFFAGAHQHGDLRRFQRFQAACFAAQAVTPRCGGVEGGGDFFGAEVCGARFQCFHVFFIRAFVQPGETHGGVALRQAALGAGGGCRLKGDFGQHERVGA